MFGFGVGKMGGVGQLKSLAAKIMALFANSEQGAWYDPSDLTTLFQDSAGTTPVTAVEQPVGLMLDKSKGLVLGGDALGGNGSFTTAGYWGLTAGATISGGQLSFNGSSTLGGGYTNSSPLTIGIYYEISFEVISITQGGVKVWAGTAVPSYTATTVGTHTYRMLCIGDGLARVYNNGTATTAVVDNVTIKVIPGNHAFQSTSAARPVLSARVNLLNATPTLSTQSVTVTAGDHTLYFTGTGSITLSGAATGTYSAGTHTITTTAASLTLTVSGSVLTADLRRSNDGVGLPVYQAVTNSTTYDTTGFPLYIKPNGSSQFMLTNSINFTGTDKMTVWAGVRKLSDGAAAILVELSTNVTTNAGSFYVASPEDATTNRYSTISRGSAGLVIGQGSYVTGIGQAPDSPVLTTTHDIAGSNSVIRRNGVAFAAGTASKGTGNFGNYPLYLFARGGTSLWYSGRFYGAVIRGAASDATQIANAEAWMNSKTKAYA